MRAAFSWAAQAATYSRMTHLFYADLTASRNPCVWPLSREARECGCPQDVIYSAAWRRRTKTISSEKHLALVQAIARKVKRTLGGAIEVDDLVGYGRKGLVEAAERFDGRAGVAFTTFAYYRIRGAMYDGIRAMGWYSRADYARYRAEERANEYLQHQADREGAARPRIPTRPAARSATPPRRWPASPRCCPASPPSTSRRSRPRRASPTRACPHRTPPSTPAASRGACARR